MRRGYEDTVVVVPITVPYVRYSIHGAHWFVARALAGLCLSSFTLAPDTAVRLTQHLGLSLRWLDHIPMGGASGIVARREDFGKLCVAQRENALKFPHALF